MIFFLTSFVVSVMAAATPLLLAATGELVTERSGVLNLGVEGMMLVGAVTGIFQGVLLFLLLACDILINFRLRLPARRSEPAGAA